MVYTLLWEHPVLEIVELAIQREALAAVGFVHHHGLVLALSEHDGKGDNKGEEKDPYGGQCG